MIENGVWNIGGRTAYCAWPAGVAALSAGSRIRLGILTISSIGRHNQYLTELYISFPSVDASRNSATTLSAPPLLLSDDKIMETGHSSTICMGRREVTVCHPMFPRHRLYSVDDIRSTGVCGWNQFPLLYLVIICSLNLSGYPERERAVSLHFRFFPSRIELFPTINKLNLTK
jgi:hypothetical protein